MIWGYQEIINQARGRPMKQQEQPRKVRCNLTAEEKARLEKYGSIEFKSAGATRQK